MIWFTLNIFRGLCPRNDFLNPTLTGKCSSLSVNRSALRKLETSGQEAQGKNLRSQNSPRLTCKILTLRRCLFVCVLDFSVAMTDSAQERVVCCAFVKSVESSQTVQAPCKEPSPQPQYHHAESIGSPASKEQPLLTGWGPGWTPQWGHQHFALGYSHGGDLMLYIYFTGGHGSELKIMWPD